MPYGDTLSIDPPVADGQPSPSRLDALLRRLDEASDRLSPIVVKEVRQIVRGREFNLSFMASLLIGLLVAFFGAASAASGTGTTGQSVFSALTACLALLGVAIVPIGAFSALRNERLEQTLDLITVTSLSARKVVVGKLLAQGVKLATLFAGMAPFVAMSFLLGGIDFVTIVVSLAVVFFASLWVCAAALVVSSLAKTRGMAGPLLAGGAFLFVLFVGGAQILPRIMLGLLGVGGGGVGGIRVFGGAPAGPEGWWTLAILTTLGTASLVNLVLLAENRLSSPVENKATALRVGFFVQLLGIIAVFHALAWFGPPLPQPVVPMAVLCLLQLAIVAAFTVTEDFSVSRRVQLRMETAAWWRRIGTALWPGGGHGAVYVVAQMAVLLVGTWHLATRPEDVRWVLAACGYICFFTGVPTAALRYLWGGFRAFHLRLAVLVLLSASLVLPDLLCYLFARPDAFSLTFSGRHLFNPLRTVINWNTVEYWFRLERLSLLVPAILGTAGLVAYGALVVMNRRATRPGQPTGPQGSLV